MAARISLFGAILAIANAVSFNVDCENGSDANGDGSSTNPWKTLGKAQVAVRAESGNSVFVSVAGDCYPGSEGSVDFTQPHLTLTSADSAAEGQLITWQSASAPSKPARLLSGLRISASSWKPAGGSFPPGVLSAPLPAGVPYGTLAPGGLGTCMHTMPELFYGQTAMLMARYPNVEPSTSSTPGKWNWLNILNVTSVNGGFTVADSRPLVWASELAAMTGWAHGYWSEDWADSYVRLLNVSAFDTPTGPGAAFGVDPSTPPVYGFLPKARWMGVHILSELDAPGEYYLDLQGGSAYAYPPGPLIDGNPDQEVWISMGNNAILGPVNSAITRGSLITGSLASHEGVTAVMPDADGLTNVAIIGFTSLYSRDTGISLPNVQGCFLSNITSSCHGRHGIEMSGANSTGQFLTVHSTGCGAAGFAGGDMNALIPAHISVTDSSFKTYARIVRTYNPGIGWFGCVGCTFARNEFADSPHNGMLGAGNDCLFLNNSFHDLCYEATDSGAWYSGRSWVRRGNVIRGNTFTNIFNTEQMTLGWPTVQAVYLDDQLSGTLIEGNTFTDCQTAIVIGGGRDVIARGNTFINSSVPVHFDNRGMNWQLDMCTYNATYTGQLVADLFTVKYTQPPYATEYPEITTSLSNNPCVPVNVTVTGNVYCNATGGQFISATANQTASWFDTVTNNTVFDC